MAASGDPWRLVAPVHKLYEQSGGFGRFLSRAHDWADPAATLQSCELMASEVFAR